MLYIIGLSVNKMKSNMDGNFSRPSSSKGYIKVSEEPVCEGNVVVVGTSPEENELTSRYLRRK